MDSQKVDLFLAANQKFFSPTQILTIKDRLLALDDDKFTLINALDYKDPTMMIIGISLRRLTRHRSLHARRHGATACSSSSRVVAAAS